MWEQFSYYGMRALLVYYMTTQLLFGQEKSSSIYGFYTAFAYFTPIIGGTIADRWLGKRRAVIIGATMMAAGHFMMASEPMFYVALATIAHRQRAVPADACRARSTISTCRRSAPAVGLQRLLCRRERRRVPRAADLRVPRRDLRLALRVRGGGRRHARRPRDLSLWPKLSAAASGPCRAASCAMRPRRHRGRDTFLLLLGIGLAVTVFRGAYEQIGNTIALWMRDDVNRTIGGVEIGAAMFFSLNPLLVMVVTPLLLARWKRQAERGREHLRDPEDGASARCSSRHPICWSPRPRPCTAGGRAHWLWLLGYFFIFTLGELYILPNGLGIFARLAPPKLGASTVAAWYLAIFSGSLSAGQVGRLWSRVGHVAFFLILAGDRVAVGGPALHVRTPDAENPGSRRTRGRGVDDLTDVPEGLGEAEQCVTRNLTRRGCLRGALAAGAVAFPMINRASFAFAAAPARQYSARAIKVVRDIARHRHACAAQARFRSQFFDQPFGAKDLAEFKASGMTGFHHSVGIGAPGAKTQALDFLASYQGWVGRQADDFTLVGTAAISIMPRPRASRRSSWGCRTRTSSRPPTTSNISTVSACAARS